MTTGKIYGPDIYDYDTKKEIQITPEYITDKGKIKNMMFVGLKDEIKMWLKLIFKRMS